jgi:prepilin-type N-terminal cleavage/methylation domain-containing protein
MAIQLRQKGFTLVEIAIVLVIIGLLLGGILKGQEMITQARIKNIINDFNGITAAYASYQDRYRAVPGDDPRAGGLSGRWTGSVSGDGNGVILGNYNAAASDPPLGTEESNTFWWHLRLAGFIPGPTTGPGVASQPTNAVSGMIGVTTGNGGSTMGLSGLIVCSANIPDKIAIAVDTQTDDQNSQGGVVRANRTTTPNPNLAVPDGQPYQETGSLQYVMCRGL